MKYRIEYNFRGKPGFWVCDAPQGLGQNEALIALLRLTLVEGGLTQQLPDTPEERMALARDLGISDVRIQGKE